MSEIVPLKTSVKVCRNCQKESTDLLRCSKCREANYCDQECQKKDWPSHKSYCKSKDIQVKPQVKEDKENKEKKEMGLQEFGKLKHIGTGNFSIIFKGQSQKDGKTYAIKQVQKAKVKRMRKEADILMQKHCLGRLKNCPYVVQLYKTFQDQMNLYFQMQCPSNGELWQLSKNFGIIPQCVYKYYICHIVKALSVLHNQYEIVHRDLKPENILLSQKYQIKLIDFGTAKDLVNPQIKGSGNGLKGKKPFEHYVGTPNYMAPECIHNKASEKKSDIYSLSGVFYFLKVGSPPFAGGSQYLVYTKSLQKMLFTCKELFSQKLQDLIQKMNAKELEKRIEIDEVMKHPYFQDVDFEKLPSYQEVSEQIKEEEKEVIKVTKQLQKMMQYEGDQPPVEDRRKVYDEKIKPYLQDLGQNNQNQLLKMRLNIIDLQCQVYLNVKDDTNESFTELYAKN